MIFNKLRSKENRNITSSMSKYTSTELITNGYEVVDGNLKEVTYFSCLKAISEGVAKCPIQVKKDGDLGEVVDKKHQLHEKLRVRPNQYMSAIDTMKTLITLFKHYGCAGLYINRSRNGKIEGLYPVRITSITIDDAGLIKVTMANKILYDFVSVGNEYGNCFDKDIVILRDFTLDGINTKSIQDVLGENLNTSLKSQEYLNKLFQNGLTNKLVVQMTSDIKDEKELKKVQAKFNSMYSSNGRVFTLPSSYSVSALNLSLADAQYEQLRRLSKEEIAGAFGVPMSKLGFVKENAKSEEQDNLKFYQDTLLVIFQQLEQEMDYKLLTESERQRGYKIRFNVNVLLRTDQKTQAEIITKYVTSGVYSLNQARDILGVERLKQDATLFPSGSITLEALLNGEASWQKSIANGGEKVNGEGN